MTIHCYTEKEFFDAIYNCVTRGLTFTADAHQMTIPLSGGF